MREIKGIVVPLVTPFNRDETVNEAALRQIVDYLVAAGVHGLFPSGSQGELFALDKDEKKRTMDVVIEQNNGRAFVMPSTGAVTTPETVARINQQAPNFGGIKDSSGDLSNTMRYIALCPPGFVTFMGRDTLIYAGLTYGCAGAVAATANVAPELVVGIYEAYQAGDLPLALERQRQLEPLRQAFALGSFPVVVKDAMELLGLPAGPCRAPIRSLTGAARERLIAILKQMGKL